MSNMIPDDTPSSSSFAFFVAVVAAILCALGGVATGHFYIGAVLMLACVVVAITVTVAGERLDNATRSRRLHWVDDARDPADDLAATVDVDGGYTRVGVVLVAFALGTAMSVLFPMVLRALGGAA